MAPGVEITRTFHVFFMMFAGEWSKVGGLSVRETHDHDPQPLVHDRFVLEPLLCARCTMEKYCNSGIAMFFQTIRKSLRVIHETVSCTN